MAAEFPQTLCSLKSVDLFIFGFGYPQKDDICSLGMRGKIEYKLVLAAVFINIYAVLVLFCDTGQYIYIFCGVSPVIVIYVNVHWYHHSILHFVQLYLTMEKLRNTTTIRIFFNISGYLISFPV